MTFIFIFRNTRIHILKKQKKNKRIDLFRIVHEKGAEKKKMIIIPRTCRIAVITVEPAGKASFVLGCIQTRLMGQYNGK